MDIIKINYYTCMWYMAHMYRMCTEGRAQ